MKERKKEGGRERERERKFAMQCTEQSERRAHSEQLASLFLKFCARGERVTTEAAATNRERERKV